MAGNWKKPKFKKVSKVEKKKNCGQEDHDQEKHLILEVEKRLIKEIKKIGRCIMTAISDYGEKQKAFNAKMAASIDGIVGDIQGLNDLITKLQNSPGSVSPEDEATLNELEAAGQALADKGEAADALTPPVPPVEPV